MKFIVFTKIFRPAYYLLGGVLFFSFLFLCLPDYHWQRFLNMN